MICCGIVVNRWRSEGETVMLSLHLFLVTSVLSVIKTPTLLEKTLFYRKINCLLRIIHKSFHCTYYLVGKCC